MRVNSVPTCAKRMAILITVVAAIDAAAAFLIAKPQIWCAIIPSLIPLLTPLVIFSRNVPSRS